jgi:hypothetical protein
MAISTVALDLALDAMTNPKVHDMAVKLFDRVYGRIFNQAEAAAIEVNTPPKPPSDREMLEKVERVVANQPSSIEMGVAFSALQAELRRGQQRLWIGLAGLAILNTVLTSILIFR